MESTWRRQHTNQRKREKVDRKKVKQKGGLFDWNESSILSFDFVR